MSYAYDPKVEEKGTGAMNVVETIVSPVDVRNIEVVFGAAEYIAFEVLIDWLLRWAFKFQKRGLMETAVLHAVSIPLIGGTAAWFDENHILGYEAPFSQIGIDGAKGVPGLFFSQYICTTAYAGFHFPSIVFKDVGILVVAKILSRFAISFAYPFMPDAMKNNLDVLESFFFKQHAKSRFKAAPAAS